MTSTELGNHNEPSLRVTTMDRAHLLTVLLRGVSRSFYLTLRVLPNAVREPIGLAYLLARAADTIADTRLIPPDDRLKTLLLFRERLCGPASSEAFRTTITNLSEKQGNLSEKELLQSLDQAFAMLHSLSAEDGARVRKVVATLTDGMVMDLTTFPYEENGYIVGLPDAQALDKYIYYVAGCVGEFWTEIISHHIGALANWNINSLSKSGIQFGKALQLTNVLRDVPRDLRMGRCYLPVNELSALRLEPKMLLDITNSQAARSLLVKWLETTLDYYQAAEHYTLMIPRRCARLRLAVLWPLLIGLSTLVELTAKTNWLDPKQPAKVTRNDVYRILLISLPVCFSNRLIQTWIGRLRRQVSRSF